MMMNALLSSRPRLDRDRDIRADSGHFLMLLVLQNLEYESS